MLYTRNAFLFRKFYKEEVAREQSWVDLNFVGSLHPDNSRRETGFAKLIYGNREDLGKFLGTIALNVAADDQAIYELIQNADDSKSSFFSVSYNEDYLLCINNGNYFSDRDMSAIINVAGNYKDGENIGTFGIGFKILHRLVGVDDGREAIINDYAGPIIFSWNEYNQFSRFLKGESVGVYGWGDTRDDYTYEKDKENAWLIKLIYTCFPSNIGERIKLNDYDTEGIKFDREEFKEMRLFLENSLENLNLTEENYLKSGSIFFLKLGKGKSKFLDDGIDKIESGLSYSFKFLNSLKKIYINGEEIKAQVVTDYSHSFPIESQEFNDINPKNKKRDIKFTFAYYWDYKRAENLQNELAPNLYTFFSMDEEKNGFSFLLHCNAFDMNNDRRKLQANSQINEKLLPIIAKNITQYIDSLRETNRNSFLSLYANLLLSKEPKSKPHINNNFFKYFQNYILENVPTLGGYANHPENVKIKDTFLNISPTDFDCSEIDWFYWNNEKIDGILIGEARNPEKLNLDKWDIIDLIKYAVQQNKVDKIDAWVKKIEFETSQFFAEEKQLKEANNSQEIKRKPKPYFSLLSEINKNILKSNFEFVAKIKLLKFSDGNFYSLHEIFESENLVLNYEKIFDIRYELQNIGFITSIINIDSMSQRGVANYSNIKDLIQTKFSDLQLFQKIALKVKLNTLRKDQKHKLFTVLQGFEGVGAEKLRDLELFKNSQGEVRPLRNLMKGNLSVPNWLFHFKIHIAEYTPELDKYLVQEEEIYQHIIYPYWENIISEVQDINDLYEKTVYYYGLKEDNKIFRTQSFIYTKKGFLLPNQVFFNSEMTKLGSQYVYFQNTIQSLFDLPTPEKKITPYLIKEPFKIDGSKFCERTVNAIALEVYEIKSVLSFCKLNNEQFFKNFIIKKSDNGFTIVQKTNATYQITSPDNEARKFIEENCKDRLLVLPTEFLESKDEDGIIKADDLHSLILDCVDVNEHKKTLIDIVKYRAKYQFLQKMSEFRFNSEIAYTKDDYEYKVLELACSELKECDYLNFKNKVVIETENGIFKLNISLSKNEFELEDVKLSLSEVLPDVHKNSSNLSKLINRFVSLGLSEDKINLLFGIKNEPEQTIIFNHLRSEYETLQNGQQLAFILLYVKTRNLNLSDFQLPKETKIDFIEFVYKRNNAILKELIVSSKSISLLNFNPQKLVYPNEYACESEQLPNYVQEWINNDSVKIQFLASLGVWIEGTTIVDLRKFWKGENSFDSAKLVRENRFDNDKTNLVNSFEYLKTKNIQLTTAEQCDVFEEAIKRRNTGCSSSYCYNIVKHYDFEVIRQQVEEWDNENYNAWKENKFFIYLFDGELPRFVKISGRFEDYVFYRFNEGDVVIEGNKIYLNKNADRKETLSKLASERNNFSFEDLWQLFGSSSISVELNDTQKEILELTKDLTVEELIEIKKTLANKNLSQAMFIGSQALSNTGADINSGELGEKIVYADLCAKFGEERVRWTSSYNPNVSYGTPEYDFEILTEDLNEILYYLDAKSTTTRKGQSDKTEIFWRNSEWNFIETKNPNNYLIARVFNCNSDNPEIVYLKIKKENMFPV